MITMMIPHTLYSTFCSPLCAPCVKKVLLFSCSQQRCKNYICINTLINNYIHIHFKTQLYASIYLYTNNISIHIYSYYSHATM